jgi:hypothetical protein
MDIDLPFGDVQKTLGLAFSGSNVVVLFRCWKVAIFRLNLGRMESG